MQEQTQESEDALAFEQARNALAIQFKHTIENQCVGKQINLVYEALVQATLTCLLSQVPPHERQGALRTISDRVLDYAFNGYTIEADTDLQGDENTEREHGADFIKKQGSQWH